MEIEETIIACERIGKNPHEVEYYNKAQLFDLIKYAEFTIEDEKEVIHYFQNVELKKGKLSKKQFKEIQQIIEEHSEELKLYELILPILTTQYNKVKDLPIGLPAKVTDTSISNIVEIDKTNYTQETSPGPEIDFDVDAALKICLLHELGVVDLLRVKGIGSNNKMAQLIAFLTKEPIKTGAANVTLGRIQNGGLVDKYQSELAALKLKFGITQ